MAQAGIRSQLVRWIGGASSAPTQQAGYRGFMVFWIGGANAPGTTPPSTGRQDIVLVAGGHHPACHSNTGVVTI